MIIKNFIEGNIEDLIDDDEEIEYDVHMYRRLNNGQTERVFEDISKKGERTRQDCTLLKEHVKYCKRQKPQRITYPQDKVTKFTNIQNQLKQPFAGYADFECFLKRELGKNVKTGITETIEKEAK